MTTINTFPTFEEALPRLLVSVESDNLEAYGPAVDELLRMARLADKAIADMAEGNLTWSMDNYPPKWERPVLLALVKAILKRGYAVDIEMEDEQIITFSADLEEIIKNLAAGDMDCLVVRRTDDVLGDSGEHFPNVGWFDLIYNNGFEHEPIGVISDYSVNEVCEEIMREVEQEVES